MVDTFSLNKSVGLPLRAISQPDGTSILVVGVDEAALVLDTIPASAGFSESTTIPGAELQLLSYVVPANETHLLTSALLSCRVESFFRFEVDGETVATARTSAASPNASINLYPASEVAPAGSTVAIFVTARLKSAPAPVECKLSGFIKPI